MKPLLILYLLSKITCNHYILISKEKTPHVKVFLILEITLVSFHFISSQSPYHVILVLHIAGELLQERHHQEEKVRRLPLLHPHQETHNVLPSHLLLHTHVFRNVEQQICTNPQHLSEG